MRVVPALSHCYDGECGEELWLDDEGDVDVLYDEVGSLGDRASDPNEEEPRREAIGRLVAVRFDDLRYQLEGPKHGAYRAEHTSKTNEKTGVRKRSAER